MTTKPAHDKVSRRTTTVPVTTMEEMPVLTPDERAELLRSLEEAEASIKAGEGVEYDPEELKAWLQATYRGDRRKE
ncbi:MAG: hypothetical protein JO366_13900 [Methylobacteriaceae bacterium]|nr:hypothetical protein [Methylobacteriaceae bacterium]MBV9220289.1 hypothetical protein [Methylobacteriaceae bacterium]MBV9245898.1 hypothetical protein [Methylobacteriaceae bacterium]